MKQTGVIIVAGGSGSRIGGPLPKQFRLLGALPVLAHTINNFAKALPGAEIVVVLPSRHISFWKDLAARFEIAGHKCVEGGSERFFSVRNGLAALSPSIELIAVQDGVRPLGSIEMIRHTAHIAEEKGSAVPVIEPVDSFREVTCANPDKESAVLSHTVDRKCLRMVQTPQIFQAERLRRAYEMSYRAEFTDDASVFEAAGERICLTEGERENLKITTPADFIVAEALLAAREEAPAERSNQE